MKYYLTLKETKSCEIWRQMKHKKQSSEWGNSETRDRYCIFSHMLVLAFYILDMPVQLTNWINSRSQEPCKESGGRRVLS